MFFSWKLGKLLQKMHLGNMIYPFRREGLLEKNIWMSVSLPPLSTLILGFKMCTFVRTYFQRNPSSFDVSCVLPIFDFDIEVRFVLRDSSRPGSPTSEDEEERKRENNDQQVGIGPANMMGKTVGGVVD